ncbi:MAG: DegT/DnrJ/EryC1/StrS family aminotransferase [Acidobacteria bacterium]|nr:DegT/DnrJ/EryC1/StrS family aminotransferase [Acidobacteriota bacterium]
MPVPAVNLKPCLDATEPAWRAHLADLFARSHFILGHHVHSLEAELAPAFHARHAITVGNGTAAIELCLRDAAITRPTQEVLTTALTAPFTGVAIATPGCRIRFADVDPETLLLDPTDAANRATKRTAALVPVHLYGQPVPLAPFRKLARDLKAVLIQDACQAHGAQHNGKPLTAYGPYVCYSFYPTKNLGCLGDGGAIMTNSPAIAKRLLSRRDGGRRGGQIAYLPGINSRLDEMQACYLRAFLPHLDDWNNMRRRTSALYEEGLRDCPGVTLLRTSPESVRHLFVLRAQRRDRLRDHLTAQGIGTGIHYPAPLHLMPAFRDAGLRRGDLPHAERATREILSLPIYPYLPTSAAHQVIERVRAFYK